MSENIQKANQKDDEIDLLDLFKKIGSTLNRWLSGLGHAFLVSIIFLLRRWLPLGFSIILGVGASYLFKATFTPFYESDLVLKNNTISNGDMISYLNRLHAYCKQNNSKGIETALSFSAQQANSIIDIRAFWIIDKNRDGTSDYVDYDDNHNIYDTVNVRMQDRLDIRVSISPPQEFPEIMKGIISFINSDSLFQQRNRLRIRQINELLARLDYDILQLDSLQKVKYFEETRNRQPQSGGQMIFLQEQKTQLVYTDIYALYGRKQTLESERDLNREIVTVLSEFATPVKRDNGGLYYGRYLIPIFFTLMLLILILLANRNKITEIYKKY